MRVLSKFAFEDMIVFVIDVDFFEDFIDYPECSLQVQHFIVVVVLCFHQLNSVLQ